MARSNSKNRSWFYTFVGDTIINGFYTRFKGIGVSKPQEPTFQALTDSVPFFIDADSAAKVDSTDALQLKQGIVIKAADANVISGSDTALGFTGGTLVTSPSQLTTAASSNANDFTVSTVPADGEATSTIDPFDVSLDASVTTRKHYLLKFKTAFIKFLLARLIPAGGTGGQALVKTDSVDYNFTWGDVAPAETGDVYKTASTSLINYGSLAVGDNIVMTVPEGLAYTDGQQVIVRSNTEDYFLANITLYDTTNLTMQVVKIDYLSGNPVQEAHVINLSGIEMPDYITDASKATLKKENGVLVWEEDGVFTSSNQFYISPGGNDTTGDGSINKPWATFSKAKTEIQTVADDTGANITLMVIGGTYTNNVNMAIERSGALYYNYTINCFPGVTINQTTTSFYNNDAINGHVDVIGAPTIAGTDTLGGANIIKIATKRNGLSQTIQSHQYKNITTVAGSLGIEIGYTAGNNNGPALCYFSASTIVTATSPSIKTIGVDTIATIKVANCANGISGGVGIELAGGGSINVVNSRVANLTIAQPFTGIKVTAAPAFNSTWAAGAGSGFNSAYVINDTVHYSRLSGSTGYFIDIAGMGDLTAKLFIDQCTFFTSTGGSGAFINGSSVADKATVRLCKSSRPASAGGVDVVAYDTDETIAVSTTVAPYYIPPFES